MSVAEHTTYQGQDKAQEQMQEPEPEQEGVQGQEPEEQQQEGQEEEEEEQQRLLAWIHEHTPNGNTLATYTPFVRRFNEICKDEPGGNAVTLGRYTTAVSPVITQVPHSSHGSALMSFRSQGVQVSVCRTRKIHVAG